METIKASAPGKVLLFGEHSVVYKKPALAIAINKRAYATVRKIKERKIIIRTPDLNLEHAYDNNSEYNNSPTYPIYYVAKKILDISEYNQGLEITIKSEIPIGGGLGSSAAVSVVTAYAVSRILDLKFNKEQVSKIAYEGEKILHGTPSGIDNTISTWGGALEFYNGKIERLNINDTPPLIIVNTKISRSTKQLVEKVRQLYNRNPDIVKHIFDAMGSIAKIGKESLLKGDWERIGELMNINQGLLASIGVSNHIIENIIGTALKNGALGGKITGAGGGGCLLILTKENNQQNIQKMLQNQNIEVITATISKEGVRDEN